MPSLLLEIGCEELPAWACAEAAAQLESQIVGTIGNGDAVMVKGSLGSKMGPIVKALAQRYRRRSTEPTAAQG